MRRRPRWSVPPSRRSTSLCAAPSRAFSGVFLSIPFFSGFLLFEPDRYAGGANGRAYALPFELKASWLQGAVWRPTAFADCGSPVTALASAWDLVFAGTASGAILALTPRLACDDPSALRAAVPSAVEWSEPPGRRAADGVDFQSFFILLSI